MALPLHAHPGLQTSARRVTCLCSSSPAQRRRKTATAAAAAAPRRLQPRRPSLRPPDEVLLRIVRAQESWRLGWGSPQAGFQAAALPQRGGKSLLPWPRHCPICLYILVSTFFLPSFMRCGCMGAAHWPIGHHLCAVAVPLLALKTFPLLRMNVSKHPLDFD